jgi:hypothetical protein
MLRARPHFTSQRERERGREGERERESDECPHYLLARVFPDPTLSPSSPVRERERERERRKERKRERERE